MRFCCIVERLDRIIHLLSKTNCSCDCDMTTTNKLLSAILDKLNTDNPDVTEWQGGIDYVVGDVVSYMGKTYNCIQSHTSQNDWTPDAHPALWGTS